MPRWPAGLHAFAGSQVARGGQPVRPPHTPQEHYWRRTSTELHAGAQSALPAIPSGTFFPGPTFASLPAVAYAGPQGAGEQWHVDLVQVQAGTQFGQPPLVIQQVIAQGQGAATVIPPPIIAQVWLCHAGMAAVYQQWQTGKLLAQSNTGGNDALSVSAPLLTMGEVICVVWYGWAASTVHPYMHVRGTRYAMSVI